MAASSEKKLPRSIFSALIKQLSPDIDNIMLVFENNIKVLQIKFVYI
jgi:hypothetical protein